MNQRKLIRPEMAEMKRDPGSRAVRRKQSPPEQTNAEEFYYLKQMAAKTSMVVVLTTGEQLIGWIEWYDKGALKLNRQREPNLLVPKASILYMFKEEELRRRGRRRAVPSSLGEVSEDARKAESDGGDEPDAV